MFGILCVDKNKPDNKMLMSNIYTTEDDAKKAINILKSKNNSIDYFPISFCKLETKASDINIQILELEKDLIKMISFDEWSFKEYGETSVDYYDTALNLYNIGYRKKG